MRHPRNHTGPNAVSPGLEVFVDRIGTEGLDIDETISKAWIDAALGPSSPFRARGAGRLAVHLEKVERVVHVRGRASIGVEGECVRCLGRVDLDLDVPVEVAMFPRGEEPPAGPEGEVVAEDMGVASYDEGIVELAGVVHDEVFLELPMNPLCAESCAGLCPRCGTNLNETRCGCAPDIDPRWQALGDLKVD